MMRGAHSNFPLIRVISATLVAACALCAPWAQAQSYSTPSSQPRSVSTSASTTAALKAAAAAVNRHIDFTGGALDNSPGSAALLDGFWTDVQQWAAARLEAGDLPRHIAEEAKRDFGVSSPLWFGLSALRLDPDSVAFGASIQSLGTVFILRRSSDGPFRAALALNEPATWGERDAGDFAGWQTENATNEAQRRSNYAGPRPLIAIDLIRLHNEADGARRFAILGHYAQMAGATQGFQLSIWRWSGGRATPLLVVPLVQMADEPLIAHVGRTRLTLRKKGHFKRFYACGDCPGRQMALTVALPPRGARLTSTRSLVPELDLADEFFDRGFRCQPLGNLVAPALAHRLKSTVDQMCRQGGGGGPRGTLGMLGTARITRHSQRETLCLTTDGLAHARIFTLARQGDRLRIAGFQVAPRTACEDRSLLKRK